VCRHPASSCKQGRNDLLTEDNLGCMADICLLRTPAGVSSARVMALVEAHCQLPAAAAARR
jgi:hypothetical protein